MSLIESNINLDLSLEFLMGRALDNAMLNTGLKTIAKGEIPEIFGDIDRLMLSL